MLQDVLLVHEDSDLLVLNKPCGMHSTSLSAGDVNTAVHVALLHCEALHGVGKSPLEPGLLHRLDRETSGLLAFAKTQGEYDRLRALWKSGAVRKVYRAVVWLAPGAELPPLPHRIDWPIGHSAKSSRKMIILPPDRPGRSSQIRGRPQPAHTQVIRCHSRIPTQTGTLLDLEIQIQTGVMHQIRCHLASLGLPIWGDPLYGKCPIPAERLHLHAWQLLLPRTEGGDLLLRAPVPWGTLQDQKSMV